MKRNKFKHKYLRTFIKTKNIKEPILKRALYGAMFDHPKKVKKGLLFSKNYNHKNYILSLVKKIAIIGKSNNVLSLLD